jgi:acetyltransferase-like isoleucine patch superfamily enzyme
MKNICVLLARVLQWPLERWFVSRPGIAINQRLYEIFEASQRNQIKLSLGSCGNNVSLQLPVCFAQPEKIHIGNDVSFAAYVHIWGGGGVTIGNRVMVGSHSAITSITHDYTAQQIYDTVIAKPIIIEDDVWIGTHVVILPGIRIGRGAVLAAGCVVTKDVPSAGIVAGVPARLVKYRPAGKEQPFGL